MLIGGLEALWIEDAFHNSFVDPLWIQETAEISFYWTKTLDHPTRYFI